MPHDSTWEIMDEVYHEGSRSAGFGISRGSNPYVAVDTRGAWFQGFDDAISQPHIHRRLTVWDALFYAVAFAALVCLLYLPTD
jgi:hypothetical protein